MEFYATLGPSCQKEETLYNMFRAGMTGARLNLSHVSLEKSKALIDAFQSAAVKAGSAPKLILDLQGPELRVGFAPEPLHLQKDDTVILGDGGIPVPEALLEALHNEDEILIDDAALLLRVSACEKSRAVCRVLRGGTLSSYKSIAAPALSIEPPALTPADRENLAAAKRYAVTAVLQPFVRGKGDIDVLREALAKSRLSDVKVIAKIENRKGMAMLPEIMESADEICIARGDLGNAIPLWELPEAQKRISACCRAAGVPFIVVTQLLHSMIESAVPTRAEVSDIFNAVLDGASALLLTGETAIGGYPVEAMHYLCRTARQAGEYMRTYGAKAMPPMLE